MQVALVASKSSNFYMQCYGEKASVHREPLLGVFVEGNLVAIIDGSIFFVYKMDNRQ